MIEPASVVAEPAPAPCPAPIVASAPVVSAPPAPTLTVVKSPRPVPARASIPMKPTADRKSIDAQLRAIEAEYERIGELLLDLDNRKADLKAARKQLAKRIG